MSKRQNAFTVMELAIVLVIIGFITASILIVRDLITAAEARRQISQIEKFNAAANAFLVKYGNLPGDLSAKLAAQNGFIARTGYRGHGDGNGLIESCDSTKSPPDFPGCEMLLFWSDLSQSHLAEEQFAFATDNYANISSDQDSKKYFPAAKIGNSAALMFISKSATLTNWFTIGMCKRVTSSSVVLEALGDPIVSESCEGRIYPSTGYAIDGKVDDGKPLKGNVIIGQQGNGSYFFGSPVQGDDDQCVDTNGEYNVDNHKSTIYCQLNFRTSLGE